MATKTCPACGAEVPQVAQRCKHCFHDFDETPVKKRGLVILLGFVAMMAIFGASTLAWVFYFSVAEKIVVDAETQSIVISRTSAMVCASGFSTYTWMPRRIASRAGGA